MYYESVKNRENWRYTYTGKDLLAAAERKRDEFHAAAEAAREEVDALLQHATTLRQKARDAIEKNGRHHEQCVVFVHEFRRNPNREFHLAIGDVVFFGLTMGE